MVIQSSINSFGATVVAGNSAAVNLEGFGYVAMNAFHQAAISFTSQNVGAKKYERVNKIALRAAICAAIVGLGFYGLIFGAGPKLLGLYTESPEVIAAGMNRVRIVTAGYFVAGMMDVLVGVLRGLGYSVVPMIGSIIGVCGIRLVWVMTIFQMPQFHNTFMIYVTYPFTWVVTTLFHFTCFIIIRKRLKKSWGK